MKKQLIIDAAYESFSSFGYKGTTMDKVAKMANVGKGTIYTFFINKEELFEEIISSHIKELRKAAEDVQDKNLSFLENLHRILYRILEFKKKNQLIIKLIQEEKIFQTKEVEEVLKRVDNEIIEFIKEKLKIGILRDEIKECDPEITAFIMVKLYVALIFDWETRKEPLKKDEIARLFELYLLNGIKAN